MTTAGHSHQINAIRVDVGVLPGVIHRAEDVSDDKFRTAGLGFVISASEMGVHKGPALGKTPLRISWLRLSIIAAPRVPGDEQRHRMVAFGLIEKSRL